MRERAGLSQEEVADVLGVGSQAVVSKLETGVARHLPPPPVWVAYVGLGLDPIGVLALEGYIPPDLAARIVTALR